MNGNGLDLFDRRLLDRVQAGALVDHDVPRSGVTELSGLASGTRELGRFLDDRRVVYDHRRGPHRFVEATDLDKHERTWNHHDATRRQRSPTAVAAANAPG